MGRTKQTARKSKSRAPRKAQKENKELDEETMATTTNKDSTTESKLATNKPDTTSSEQQGDKDSAKAQEGQLESTSDSDKTGKKRKKESAPTASGECSSTSVQSKELEDEDKEEEKATTPKKIKIAVEDTRPEQTNEAKSTIETSVSAETGVSDKVRSEKSHPDDKGEGRAEGGGSSDEAPEDVPLEQGKQKAVEQMMEETSQAERSEC